MSDPPCYDKTKKMKNELTNRENKTIQCAPRIIAQSRFTFHPPQLVHERPPHSPRAGEPLPLTATGPKWTKMDFIF
jgi:hypothetical protein